MYLSKLDIIGFKSFALKTSLEFPAGITAIVGPNGCGKSNVVDAVRWVLGEQKSKVLRSDVMENIIFNGNQKRKPLGMAEVSLTIENTKGILPLEYTEITITRRLFRSGESQYFLNKTAVRLRDIVNLFMDTGMGADSYSVIELKMVEQILSGKTDERRHLLEEAASISKYKIQLRDATRKLKDVESDMTRVMDITTELEKTVASLGNQADKVRRYNATSGKLQEVEIYVLRKEYIASHGELKVVNEELQAFLEKRKEIETTLEHQENYTNELEERSRHEENEVNTLRYKENDLRTQLAKLEQEFAVADERIKAINQSTFRLGNEQSDLENAQQNLNRTLEQTKIRKEGIEKTIEELRTSFQESKVVRDQKSQALQELRHLSRRVNEQYYNALNGLNGLKGIIERNARTTAQKQSIITEQQSGIAREETALAEKQTLINAEELKRTDFEKAIEKAEKLYKQKVELQASLQSSIEGLRQGLSDEQQQRSYLNASLEFLTSLVDSSESSKFLQQNLQWNNNHEFSTLAEVIGTDEPYRIALEAALGDASKYIVVATEQEALSAAKILKESKKGKATFLCKSTIPTSQKKVKPIKGEGIIGWVHDLVRADKEILSAISLLCGNCVIVENLQIAEKLVSSNTEVELAVTLEGELVSSSGYIRGGSVSKSEGISVGKKERIQQLQESLQTIQESIATKEASLKDLRSQLQEININELTQAVRRAENEKNNFERSLAQMIAGTDSIRQRIENNRKNLTRTQDELQELERESAETTKNITAKEEEVSSFKQQTDEITKQLQEFESEYSSVEATVRQKELQLVQTEGENNSLRADIDRITNSIRNLDNRKKGFTTDIESSKQKLEELKETVKQKETEIRTFREDLVNISNDREQLETILRSTKEELHQYTEESKQLRSVLEKNIRNVHEREVTIATLTQKIESILQKASDELQISIEDEQPMTPELEKLQESSHEELLELIRVYRKRLLSYGNVNFEALESFERENERLEILQAQLKDLTEGQETLKTTIAEINEIAQKQFNDTFEKINVYFKELFQVLFGGEGECAITLGEGDPLEASIEVTAKPPGKKPNTIESLSGGEKTMTAIALLFAIYMVKPSPFCILDEVDAPLDDANIGRYIEMIRKFSVNTQFLMITHNKKTMEAADSLYGVTQEERGVSKIVSAKLTSNVA
ncbi:MAG: chromosome segregation protein SMC [Candidatus Kapabacteria bacterium]|nr:chromosome segregation protein SMC [Candidatus Kapabacteria bacterium]